MQRDALHEAAEGFGVAYAGTVGEPGSALTRNHNPASPVDFADVERAFWNLARQ